MSLYMLWPAGLALGVVATWVGEPELLAHDSVTGFVLLGLGLIAWSRRPQSAAGPIMAAAGLAWFLGSLFGLAEVDRLLALGASEVDWDERPPDADYVILADPEGNRFCVVDLTR